MSDQTERYIIKWDSNGHQLRFTDDGDLVEILFDTGNGNYARLDGESFLSLTETVLKVAQQRVQLKADKRAAELKLAEEEWAKLPKPKYPHVSAPQDSLTERCVNCGYGETIVVKMVAHYSGFLPYALQECPGSPEALKEERREKSRIALAELDAEVRKVTESSSQLVSELDQVDKKE